MSPTPSTARRALLALLILALLVTGASTLLEGLLGADMTPGPVAMAATSIASLIIWLTRKPTAGLIVSAWLALGPLAMPWTRDQLAHPQHPGVFAATVVQLVANATALILAIVLRAGGKIIGGARRQAGSYQGGAS
jgi:hypothetical protein